MWTVVFVYYEFDIVRNKKEKLENESFKVRVKKRVSEGLEPESFEILVPDAEVPLALAQVG